MKILRIDYWGIKLGSHNGKVWMAFGMRNEEFEKGKNNQMWGNKGLSSWSSGWVACYPWCLEGIQDHGKIWGGRKQTWKASRKQWGSQWMTVSERCFYHHRHCHRHHRQHDIYWYVEVVHMFFGSHAEVKRHRSSVIWVSGIKFRSPGLVAGTSSQRARPITGFNWMVTPQSR